MTTNTEGNGIDRLYRATQTPQFVQVPPLRFNSIDGHGDPNTAPAYATAVQALCSALPPSPYGDSMAGWARMNVLGTRAAMSFMAAPDVKEWPDGVALNPARISPDHPASAARPTTPASGWRPTRSRDWRDCRND